MIKFPKMSIAESVVNRILNAADEMPQPQISPGGAQQVPAMPDVQMQGQALDSAIAAPVPEMPALSDDPMSDTANAVEPVLHGGTSLDGLIDKTSGM